MTRQKIVAVFLFAAAVLLLARQLYRMYKGKTGGCSCAPPKDTPKNMPKETPDDSSPTDDA